MANPGSAVPSWLKKHGVQVALVGSSTAPGDAFEHKIWDSEFGVIPTPGQKLENLGNSVTGTPVEAEDDTVLTPARPKFTIETRLTKRNLAIALTSLMQSDGYDAGTTSYKPVLWSVPYAATPLLMHMEAGLPGTYGAVYKALGAIVRSLAIKVPPVDESGGKPTMTWEIGACDGSRLNDFSLTPLQPAKSATLDAALRSNGCSLLIAGGAGKAREFDIKLDNSANCNGNLQVTPDSWALDAFKITGNLSVIMCDQVGDEWNLLNAAYEGNTSIVLKLVLAPTSGAYVQFRAKLDEPKHSKQGSLTIVQFPFRNVDVVGSATDWEAAINCGSDILNWAS